MNEVDAMHPQQEEVNTYFHAEAAYWKNVYSSIGGVQAENIRDRHAAVLQWIDDLALAPGSRVLEVGCGAGFMAIDLANRGFHVHAVDSVAAMIELARSNAVQAGITDTLSFGVSDVLSLAFDAPSFDLVLAVGVIPWLGQPEAAMQEMARVTKPGGHVLITTSNRAGLINLVDPLINPLLQPFKVKAKHVLVRLGLRSPTPNKTFHSNGYIDRTLGGMGLIKVKGMTRGFGFSFFRRSVFPEQLGIEINRRLQQLADRQTPGLRSLGRAYIVLARKSVSQA
jgi:ubiquinone/menaquinone biosynthesis C-methylase UbiE